MRDTLALLHPRVAPGKRLTSCQTQHFQLVKVHFWQVITRRISIGAIFQITVNISFVESLLNELKLSYRLLDAGLNHTADLINQNSSCYRLQ